MKCKEPGCENESDYGTCYDHQGKLISPEC